MVVVTTVLVDVVVFFPLSLFFVAVAVAITAVINAKFDQLVKIEKRARNIRALLWGLILCLLSHSLKLISFASRNHMQ